MKDKDRKYYITHIALAICNLARLPATEAVREKIYHFGDAIIGLAEKSDLRITNNKKQFDSILDEAKKINNL